MKKILFLFLIGFIIIPFLTSAQSFSIGGKAGLNIIPLEKQELKGKLFSMGYHFGVAGEYKINEWFSLSAELIYTTRKKTYDLYDTTSFVETLSKNPFFSLVGVNLNDILDSIGDINNLINDHVYGHTQAITNLTYIKIPVLARFNYKSLYFSLGPYVSFKIIDKTTKEYSQHIPLLESVKAFDTIPFFDMVIESSFPAYKQSVSEQIKGDKNIRKTDFGIIADISYKINPDIIIGIRYTQGLVNYRNPEIYKNGYLSSINFSIGYLLNFDRSEKAMLK